MRRDGFFRRNRSISCLTLVGPLTSNFDYLLCGKRYTLARLLETTSCRMACYKMYEVMWYEDTPKSPLGTGFWNPPTSRKNSDPIENPVLFLTCVPANQPAWQLCFILRTAWPSWPLSPCQRCRLATCGGRGRAPYQELPAVGNKYLCTIVCQKWKRNKYDRFDFWHTISVSTWTFQDLKFKCYHDSFPTMIHVIIYRHPFL